MALPVAISDGVTGAQSTASREMPTTGALSRVPPIDPSNGAPPNARMSTYAATDQYPGPSGFAAKPVTG